MKFKRTIYLDMDGVLVDFEKEFLKRFEMPLEEKEKLTSDEFWALFNTKSEDFFLNAPPIDDAFAGVMTVLDLAEKHDFAVEILTAVPKLSRYPTAKTEKRMWLQNNSLDAIPFNIGPYAKDKQNHCQKGDILIDDNALNIIQWNNRGGIGVFHHNWKASIKYLTSYLDNQAEFA